MNVKLNKIFYGPPGTGKTYHTIDESLKILVPEFYKSTSNRKLLKKKYDELYNQGYIGFVTFHQSFSYEDFVEGIRAKTDDKGGLVYYIQDGIFKIMCGNNITTSLNVDEQILGYTIVDINQYVVTLKKPQTQNYIDFSWSLIKDLKNLVESGTILLDDIRNKEVFNKIDNKNTHLEKHIVNGYNQLLYSLIDKIINLNGNNKDEKCVLIIDEINRGNTANIFGELITLIEPSKRDGTEESLSVVLPYSKEKFSVPNNLYIIGTMNTADRSLALIDTALRRRFQFQEMLPKPEILSEINIDGVDVQQLLIVMNKRIALLYDREHTLGHSFFLSLDKSSTIENLREIFEGQILPLLEEYFFEDWEKIRQVLGDPLKPKELQIIKPDVDESEVSLLLGDGNMNMLNSLYARDHTALSNPQAYIAIYDRS